MDLNIVMKKINHCIDRIYEEDGDLFDRGNYEVTISTKLAQYLFMEFRKYDVDCEYDKHINDEKEIIINGEKKIIRPDIAIHKRGTDEHNLVAIEIKKEQNKDRREHDYEKLCALTSNEENYQYQLGVFIDFTKRYEDRIIEYFYNGGVLH